MGRGGEEGTFDLGSPERLLAADSLLELTALPGPEATELWADPWLDERDLPIREEVERQLRAPGRMIGSKTGYRDDHPDNLAVFNAQVFVGSTRVWSGDLDVTLDQRQLATLSRRLGYPVSVCHEQRFASETRVPRDALIVFWPNGQLELDGDYARLGGHGAVQRA